MPYVQVLKDLSEVKTKLAFSSAGRQLICFSGTAAARAPTYLLTRSVTGNTPATLLMVGLMPPLFFSAIFERDGLPPGRILRNFIRARLLWPQVRPYKTESFYAAWNGPDTPGQLGPKQGDAPKGGTRIAKGKNGGTAHTEAGRQ